MNTITIPDLRARRAGALRTARLLAIGIFLAAGVAAGGGLFLNDSSGYGLGPADPKVITTSFGRQVTLDSTGLYRRDSVSFAAQERAQDLVTLVFALPLLAVAYILAGRGSLGGRLLLAGALGYFLYCYAMMSVGTAYNEFFLLYVGLFAASLYAFILSVYAIDADVLASVCASGYPRRSAVVLCTVIAAFLGLNWLGGIILPSLSSGQAPA